MRRFFLPLFSGIVFLTFQTTLLASLPIARGKPDLVLILILYWSRSCPPVHGGILALTMGYLVDLFSGNSFGLYTFSTPLVFCVARFYKQRFYLEGFRAQFFFVFVFSMAEGFLTVVLFKVLHPVRMADLFGSLLSSVVPQSLVSGLVAPFLFTLFDDVPLLLLGQPGRDMEEKELT